ncbi:envelope stress sensor histidine kinase CpxA [Thaumasiovibrio sp. DFM-14]|uniref:envelope stress sensor histidine kinase CpxA n=1 Tax=Thaumasiovibrio sp. DFM-14 TaxID=3384792 RepID=UPI00399FD22D
MNLPRFSSLYGRIFATFWCTLLIVVIALLALPRFDPRSQHNIPQQHLEGTQQSIAQFSKVSLPLERKIELIRNKQKELNYVAHFTSPDGNPIGRVPMPMARGIASFAASSYDPSNPQQQRFGHGIVSGPFILNAEDGSAYMYLIRRGTNKIPWFIRLLDEPFKMLLITMLVSTPFLLWLAWAVTQPARRLQLAAEKVSRGQLEPDPSLEKGPSEFIKTGQSFNHMVSTLNKMIYGQQRLLSDISHELRSPLTRLRMAAALAARKQGSSKEIDRIDTEAERLESMICDLLDLSRMQINSHMEFQHCNAEDIWLEMLKDARFEAEQLDKQLHWNQLEEWHLFAHPSLLYSALENVIRNAIKYAQTEISISFTADNNTLTVIIDDDGAGVPEAERGEIFKPFYRVSTARDRHSGGTGLGLSITENAVRQHNGSIDASQSPLGGLRITLSLPLSPINNSAA